jgi:hypothetical protein
MAQSTGVAKREVAKVYLRGREAVQERREAVVGRVAEHFPERTPVEVPPFLAAALAAAAVASSGVPGGTAASAAWPER